MALTPRKKKGIGYAISGGAFWIVAIVLLVTTQTPTWVNAVLGLGGLVAQFFGFVTVFPDSTD